MARRPAPPPSAGARWRPAVLGAVLGALLALIAFAPARWLGDALAQATAGQLRLEAARGTVWTGSARLLLTGGAESTDRSALPGRVQWHLRPGWPGGPGLALTLQADCCTQAPLALALRPGWGRAVVAVADGRSRWPAGLLTGLGTPWNTLQPEGEMQLSTQGLSVEWVEGRLAVAGRAELVAQRVASRLSTVKPMGSYRITLQGGTPPTLQLDTLEGPLQLTGSGQWVGRRLNFRGEARASGREEAALGNLLNLIGRREGARSIITIG